MVGQNSAGASAGVGREHICFCLVEEDIDKLNDEWILCDGCDKFFHQKCHFISDDEFKRLAIVGEKWYCSASKCQRKGLNRGVAHSD